MAPANKVWWTAKPRKLINHSVDHHVIYILCVNWESGLVLLDDRIEKYTSHYTIKILSLKEKK